MKKSIVLSLTVLLALGIVGCNNANTNQTQDVDKPAVQEPVNPDTSETPTISEIETPNISNGASETPNTPTTPDNQNTPVADDIDPEAFATMGLDEKLLNSFKIELAKNSNDLMKTAEALSDESLTGYNCMVVECEEGYLNGFDGDIVGFKQAVCFSPVIGTIPFVCYLFEVDDPATFESQLYARANPRWNICTEAEDPVSTIEGNYVLFAMCPEQDTRSSDTNYIMEPSEEEIKQSENSVNTVE